MMQMPLGSGEAEMLSEEEGWPCCTQNNYCTNGREIQSSSIRSEVLKQITNTASYRMTELQPCEGPTKCHRSQADRLHVHW